MRLRILIATLIAGASMALGAEGPVPDLTALQGIQLDMAAHRLTVEGYVCLDEGILEYLAVAAGAKEYESVLALKCKPAGLHAALLLIGGQPGDIDAQFIEDPPVLPEGVKPKGRLGDRFQITVRWKQDGQDRECSANQLLFSRKAKQPAPDVRWVFTGSYFLKDPESGKELYMADLDGSLAATFYDAAAILNMAAAEGNPYRGEQLGFQVNRDVVPPKRTPVQVTFQLPQVAWEKPTEAPK